MKDLSFIVDENVKLNVRTTGVFVHNGKVLVHKSDEVEHYALPGGRVQAAEDSISALKREIQEELNLQTENTSFIGVIENFFKAPECNFHEYMWLIRADFKDKSIYEQEKIIGKEKDSDLVFEWLDVNELEKVDFRPVAAIPYIKNLDGQIHHKIYKEF